MFISLYLAEEKETLICDECEELIEHKQTAWLDIEKINSGANHVYCKSCYDKKKPRET